MLMQTKSSIMSGLCFTCTLLVIIVQITTTSAATLQKAAKRNVGVSLQNSKFIQNKEQGRIAITSKDYNKEMKAETLGLGTNRKALQRLAKDHLSVHEGDIVAKIGSPVDDLLNGKKVAKRELLKSAKWPTEIKDGAETVTIPYILDSSLGQEAREAINNAIEDYKSLTCVRFEPRSSEDHYIKFTVDSGCWSYVGKIGGEQPISIGNGCEFKGTVLHEMLHALGFFHEHTRPDRDEYLTINTENIPKNMMENFNKYDHNLVNDFNAKYDYLSVMQYSAYAFAIDNSKKTIESKNPDVPDSDLGQRRGLSETDISQIKSAYCGQVPSTTTTTTVKLNPNPTPAAATTITTPTTTTTVPTTTTTTPLTETTTETTSVDKTTTTEEPPTKPIVPGQTTKTMTTTKGPSGEESTTITPAPETQPTVDPNTCQTPNPCWPQDFTWSYNGYPTSCCNKNHTSVATSKEVDIQTNCKRCNCLNVKGEGTAKAWDDNYLCARKKSMNPSLSLSHGSSHEKDCLSFTNAKEWKDLKLCFGKDIPYNLSWSDTDQVDQNGKSRCLRISEPQDWSFNQKYLCS